MKKPLEPFDIEVEIKEIEKIGIRKWLMRMLTEAFYEARKGKLKTHDEHVFEINWMENLTVLRDAILEERYRPGASKAFVIHDPMVREIFAAKFRDRVIHHLLFRMQAEWWDKRFIYDSYSCRRGKGTHFGIKRAQTMMGRAINEAMKKAEKAGKSRKAWREPEFCPWIIKMDISGYFMSLSRKKVYARVKWGLEQQFGRYMDDPNGFRIYKMCEFLWKEIIFDDPASKATKSGDLKNWDPQILPPRKSLFCQKPGVGLVIGNLTSQLCSNIYLDQLDRFVTKELGYKFYGRYVDDFFFIVQADEYEKAKKDVKRIENFLKDELDLTLHQKKRYYQQVYKGMEFVGARVYPYCKYPSDRLQRKSHAGFRKFAEGRAKEDTVVSYMGLLSQLDTGAFLQKTFEEVGWEYLR